jgi:hypothetical protein
VATLLDIARRVVRGVGILAPSAIYGSSDETAERLLEAAQAAGEMMLRQRAWIALVLEHSFDTVADQASYDLPSDFARLVTDTAWQASNNWNMRGNMTPAQWQFEQNALIARPSIQKGFRVKVSSGTKKFYLTPTPTAVEGIVFEYVSKNWCQSSGGTGQSAWAADTDVLLLDEDLFVLATRWLFKQSNGLPFAVDYELWMSQVRAASAQELALPMVNLARGGVTGRWPPVPEGSWGV